MFRPRPGGGAWSQQSAYGAEPVEDRVGDDYDSGTDEECPAPTDEIRAITRLEGEALAMLDEASRPLPCTMALVGAAASVDRNPPNSRRCPDQWSVGVGRQMQPERDWERAWRETPSLHLPRLPCC